jgi:hypothetical protein
MQAEALVRLRQVLQSDAQDLRTIIAPRDEVLARFQPIFSPEHAPAITEDEFRSFLMFANNRHWPLHRQGPKMCADMDRLRNALSLLLDESTPIQERLNRVVSSVPGMGRAVVTAILLVAYPEDYGVWNNTSEGALKSLGLWPTFDRGESFGGRYLKVNSVLRELAQTLGTDLWTLDATMWFVARDTQEGDDPARPLPQGSDDVAAPSAGDQRFGLERHLHEFLRDNWDRTSLGQEWALYTEDGDEEAGFEYPCGAVGRIDLLARHRTEPKLLVVELKRGQGSDATVGQVLRYMTYVRKHVAQPGEEVRGLVIAQEADDSLRYALAAVPDVELQLYQLQFSLRALDDPGVPC